MRLFIPTLFHTQNWLTLESVKSYPMEGDKVINFLRCQKLEAHSIKNDVHIELNATQFDELKKVVDATKNYWFERIKHEVVLKCF